MDAKITIIATQAETVAVEGEYLRRKKLANPK
jgi:hypothetical protein